MLGLIHVYCGSGKGKTTCAAGLALRVAAHGDKVVIVQFLKDGGSGEMRLLAERDGVQLFADYPTGCICRPYTAQEQADLAGRARTLLKQGIDAAVRGGARLLVLDEVCAAVTRGLLDEAAVTSFLDRKPTSLEVVLTGRNPPESFVSRADYVSEIQKRKHPYDRGIGSREGIES